MPFPHKECLWYGFALKLKKVPKKEIEERVEEALKMVQLNGYQKRSIQNYQVVNVNVWLLSKGIINQPRGPLDEPCQHWIWNYVLKCNTSCANCNNVRITFALPLRPKEALAMSDGILLRNGWWNCSTVEPADIHDETDQSLRCNLYWRI